jgi:hypothetical protein
MGTTSGSFCSPLDQRARRRLLCQTLGIPGVSPVDNPNFILPDAMADTLETVWEIFGVLEPNRSRVNLSVRRTATRQPRDLRVARRAR